MRDHTPRLKARLEVGAPSAHGCRGATRSGATACLRIDCSLAPAGARRSAGRVSSKTSLSKDESSWAKRLAVLRL